MGIKNIINKFEAKKLKLQQKQTSSLNKKRLKAKAQFKREEVKSKNRKEIIKYEKGTAKLKAGNKRQNAFGSRVRGNIKQKSSAINDSPYWLKSGNNSSGSSMFGGDASPPYWLQGEKKKEKKEKSKGRIVINL